MSFFQTIRSSLSALFHVSTSGAGASGEELVTLEDIRSAMLEMIGKPTEATMPLVRRTRYATDPQALWFLRSELMGLLARREGEALARTRLEVLSDMFRELLPSGLRSRPSPLLSAKEERGNSHPG